MLDLHQLRVLIVEDESMQASLLEEELTERGAHVVASVADLVGARAVLADADPCDVVILDLTLRDGDALELGAQAIARGLLVVFATARSPWVLDGRHAGATFFQKPFLIHDLLRTLSQAWELRRQGALRLI